MQINVSLSGAIPARQSTELSGKSTPVQGGFPRLLESVREHQKLSGQIAALQSRALSGAQLSPRDLLLMQVQMGRFSMQVELVSRVAESVTTTLKRLQTAQ